MIEVVTRSLTSHTSAILLSVSVPPTILTHLRAAVDTCITITIVVKKLTLVFLVHVLGMYTAHIPIVPFIVIHISSAHLILLPLLVLIPRVILLADGHLKVCILPFGTFSLKGSILPAHVFYLVLL